ncbi:hypothetical protein [Pseudomonas guariconensis]|uniref:hypothetical protein n=1 Tax=Pseudomonas guariconensis TaxID=1288410 RepID=UPI00384E955E
MNVASSGIHPIVNFEDVMMEKNDPSATSRPGSTQDHLHAIADEAGALLDDAKTQGTHQYEQYRDRAAEQLDALKEGARSAASELEGHDSLGLSHYLNQAATCMGSFAEQVRHESAESLLKRGAQLARDKPALFLAGSVAVGFALSRFASASNRHATAEPPQPTTHAPPEPDHTLPVVPDRASDVSTHKPYTPVDPVGLGAGRPVSDSPLDRDPLKGGE